jgi:DNA-binding transcriptional regulator YdaS (Cro superfamily)
MKTPTTTRPRKTAAATPAIHLNPFTVTTVAQWVSVTLQIPASHAEYLESLAENITAGLEMDLNHHALTVADIINAQPSDLAARLRHFQDEAARHSSLAAMESTKPVSFPMLAEQWNDFQAIAARLGTAPENLARSVIAKRITQIMRFNARRRAVVGSAA